MKPQHHKTESNGVHGPATKPTNPRRLRGRGRVHWEDDCEPIPADDVTPGMDEVLNELRLGHLDGCATDDCASEEPLFDGVLSHGLNGGGNHFSICGLLPANLSGQRRNREAPFDEANMVSPIEVETFAGKLGFLPEGGTRFWNSRSGKTS